VPNPWLGVQLVSRKKAKKPAVSREQVYVFARKAIALGQPHIGAAAVICFEWLQRPENVIGGYIRRGDYRGREEPSKIRIEHHKTGETVLHPRARRQRDALLRRRRGSPGGGAAPWAVDRCQ